ncbi:MAG: RHS repeat-associated core domain-containing protein [Haliea sp.]|uniref:putative Ig domain-containing protein n=1 Tax=Haliea sp. TaxID=1932666 RepID=UPI0032ECAE5C
MGDFFSVGGRCLGLVCLLLCSVDGARAQVSLTLGDASLAAGDSGSVTATIGTDGSAVALQFDILYDPAIVSIGTVNGGAVLTGSHSIASNPIGSGRDRVVITTAPVVALGAGGLATINLAVADTAVAGSTALTFDNVVISDAVAQAISPASLTPGTITITGGAHAPVEPEVIPASPAWALLLLMAIMVSLARRHAVLTWRGAAGSLLAFALLGTLAPLSQAQNLPGDANNDGLINAEDVRLIVERILERGLLPGDGDCNRDARINVLDTVCSQLPFEPGETAPIILGPGDRSIPAGTLFEMTLFAADPDPRATLAWELVSGPGGLSVSPAGVLSWTPGDGDVGDSAVTVRATDDTARTHEASFVITVFTETAAPQDNAPPVLTVPAAQTLRVGTPLSAQVSATDPDAGDTLTFRLINGPAGMSIDPDTGALSWTPQATQGRTADVVVEVADAAGAVDFGSFTVTATPLNTAPTAVDDVYIARKGETLMIPAPEGVLQNDSDPQGDALAGTRLTDPTKGTVDAFSADGSFSYTPVTAEPITIGIVEKCRTAARVSAGTMSAADVDGDGDVELVGLVGGGRNGLFTEVFVVDPSDCSSTTASISEDLGAASVTSLTTLVNLDDDPELELVSQYFRFNTQIPTTSFPQALYAVNLDGSQLANWPAEGLSEVVSFPRVGNAFHQNASPVPVDLDGDGDTELIVGFTNVGGVATFNNTFGNAVVAYDGRTGEILWEYIGGITRTVARAVTPTIVDLDMDGDTEIIWNQLVLDHEGNLLFELPVEQTIPGGGSDFLNVAIANFDNDAFPEILGIDASNFYLFSHDGAVQWQVPYDSRGFAAPYSDITVAELDGDPFPEFVMMLPSDGGSSVDRTLRAFDSDGQPLWDQVDEGFVVQTFTESRSSTPVAFDFNNDGIDELIQFKAPPLAMPGGGQQEGGLYIINGETGAVITFQPGLANNNYDQALTVADVDGDGSAEIITNMATEFGADTVQIWDNLPGEPFPPARGIRSGTNSHPTWINVDGSVPSSIAPHWLQPGRNGWHMIQPDIDPLEPERDSFTYSASDGEFDSATATVNIEVRPNGNPPFFLSEPDRATSAGVSYRYQPLVTDVDPGDAVSFELLNGPPGMTMDPATGAIDWYADSNGAYPVSLAATDTLGLSSAQIFTLTVGDPVAVPELIGLSEAGAGSALAAADLELGSRFFRSDPVVDAGIVLAQNPPAGAVAELGAAVRVTLSSGPSRADTDGDGDGFTPNEGDCNDEADAIYPGAPEIDGDGIDQSCNGIDGNKTLASIEVSPSDRRLLTGEPQPLRAMGIFTDGTAQDVTRLASWTRGPTFSANSAGNFTAEARLHGVTGSADFTVVARVDDDLAPIARIEAPGNGDALTAPVAVRGIASDTNRLRWQLAYRYAGEDDFIVFAEGTNTVSSGPFADFDPTTLLNGLYTLRLQVFDRGGNVSEDTITVMVDSQLKVGNFTLRYVDLQLPLNGIPITLARTYDSRDKRVGDFGVGWRLGLESIELRTNRELGSGWQVFRQGLSYGLADNDVHIAALRLPGGRIEAFEMVVAPKVSPIVPFPPFSQSVSFRALPGTLGTLTSLESNNVSILEPQPGPVSLRLDSDGSVYDPTLFRYTAPDGTQVDVDRVDGVQRIATPGGQVLTLTATSIAHSNGTVVNLERDALGRITRITDPVGFSQSYRYDTNGDLRTHSDQEDYVTRYDYDADHHIIGITDPLNRAIARNEYDELGRLISVTNGNGETTTFDHDVGARQEQITDADGFVTVYDYDENGNVIRVTDPLGGITTNTYDVRGNTLSTTNAEGETTTYSYDNRDNLLTETDPLGAVTRFTYDASDRVTREEDALGRQTRYAYGSNGRLKSIEDPAGNIRALTTDAAGNLVAETDGRGIVKRFEYDSRGFQTAYVDGRGNRLQRRFDANGNSLSREDARGGSDTYSRDGRGLLTAVTAPAGNTMGFGFNPLGELLSMQDADGNTVTVTEDATGNVISVVDPDGSVTRHFYDGRGNRITTVDGSGNETRYEYDPLGRQVRRLLPAGSVFESSYDLEGRLLTETDPSGNVTTYEYDAAGRNTVLTDALGNRTVFSYDLVGNLTSRLDARGNLTRYRYDALDRLLETEYPDGTRDSTDYDAVGNVVAETDRLGRTRSYRYDGNSNLISVTETHGAVTTFSYDKNDNRISHTDANGRKTRMVYDANDRLIETQYPDGSTERYAYNAAGQVEQTVLPDGKYIDATFDGFGRPTGRDLSGESSESFRYDAEGRLAGATNLWGTVEYDYDPDGRVSEIRSEGGHSVRYDYDGVGNRTSLTTQVNGQAARTTNYTYDALNRLHTVAEPDGDTTTYSYDPVGNVASIAYPNDVVSTFTYDNVNQLTRIEHRKGGSTLASYDYTLDAGGRRTRVDHGNGESVVYNYDAADRLLQETHRNAGGVVIFEQTFTYDPVGNRLTRQISGQARTLLAYDSADKLLSAGTSSFFYDPNGRLVSRTAPQGTISYTYDAEGQLLRVTTSTGTTSYAYDARGKRRQRTVGGDEQNFLFDENSLTGYDQTLVAVDGSDTPLAEYYWGDRLLSADDGSSDRFYHADATGSVRLLTDEAGGVSDSYDYTAFGSVRSRTGSADNPYGFSGEWQAGGEGLLYLRARYYDPGTGRFISRDPFGGNARDPVSLHRYLYANANPVMYSDPSGEVTLKELGIAAAINAVISIASDGIRALLGGEVTVKEVIVNATTSAIFGAIGGGLVGNVAKGFATAATAATRKGLLYAGMIASKAAINTFTGVAGAISSSLLLGNKPAVSGGNVVQVFFINMIAETVTFGIWSPGVFKPGPSEASLRAATSSGPAGTQRTASQLLAKLQPGDDAFVLLSYYARTDTGKKGALASALLEDVSSQSLIIMRAEVMVGPGKLFANSAGFDFFVEGAKKATEIGWNTYRASSP